MSVSIVSVGRFGSNIISNKGKFIFSLGILNLFFIKSDKFGIKGKEIIFPTFKLISFIVSEFISGFEWIKLNISFFAKISFSSLLLFSS